MKMLKVCITGLLILFIGSISCKAQILETKQYLSFKFGTISIHGNSDNVFFPSIANQNGVVMELDYGHKIKPWLAGGLSLAYNQLAAPNVESSFTQIVSKGGTIFTAGPQIVFHSPFKADGIFNWLQIGLAVAPQYHYYSGERYIIIDNEVISVNGLGAMAPTIKMNSNSSGFGAKFSPEINYRITQRIGVRLAYNLQFLNVYTGYDQEKIIGQSFSAGLLFTFGNYKQLF